MSDDLFNTIESFKKDFSNTTAGKEAQKKIDDLVSENDDLTKKIAEDTKKRKSNYYHISKLRDDFSKLQSQFVLSRLEENLTGKSTSDEYFTF